MARDTLWQSNGVATALALPLLLPFSLCGAALAQGAEDVPVEQAIAAALPAFTVAATRETTPVATLDDAADDPAIWRNRREPEKSLVIGTDKRAGIHVYDLQGKAVSFTPSPRLNNVDLRDRVMIAGKRGIIVVASDRQDVARAAIALFRLDVAARRLVPLATLPVGPGEAYGMCLWQRASDGAIHAFLVLKDGRIDQFALDLAGPVPRGTLVRQMKLGSQSEGCVVDDRTGLLYVAEEDVGLWRFSADPAASRLPEALGRADGRQLVADAEGLAIIPKGRTGGYLLASSQGDNAYTLYDLKSGAYLTRFRIGNGRVRTSADVDGVQETDGLEFVPGRFGPEFPNGLLVVQDGDNSPEAQNFKYVSWQQVIRAMR